MNGVLKNDIDTNIKTIKDNFEDELLKERTIINQYNSNVSFGILYFSNLAKKELISINVIKPILEYSKKFETNDVLEHVTKNILFINEVKPTKDLFEIYKELLRGKTIILCSKNDYCLIVDTDDRKSRAIMEPDVERILRGPREGFVESMMMNIAMIRNKIMTSKLKFEYIEIGEITKTRGCICYVEDKVDKKALEILRYRLSKYKPDGIMDTNSIAEHIRDFKYSPFKTTGVTEKPDVIAAKLIEGKTALMVDGSPSVIYLPVLFVELFHTDEDYYIGYVFTSVGRLLRLIGFLISIILPGAYVAVVTHHWEIIPAPLLIAILSSQQGVPFPTVVECAMLLTVFELLRESGLRAPSGIGQSISVVGAIVVGQAAVEARLVSTTMIFIIALTAISGLITTKLKGASIIFRFAFLLAGSLLGLYGIYIVLLMLLIHLIRLQSFGVQYTERFFPFKLKNLKHGLLRLPKRDINKS